MLALGSAVEADPGRQRVVSYLHDDPSRPRASLHLLSVLFPGGGGVRALGPDGALRRAALVDLVEDGPWAGHTVVVRPTVMWALAGDASTDDQLPLGTELRAWDGPSDGTGLVAVTGEDAVRRVRRVREAMRRSSGRRFLVAPTPATDDEWAALVREATIVGAGVIVELEDQVPPIGRRWMERAEHLAWAVTSRLELPIEQMPDRPWRDHHAAATEPTDEEWAAALGDIPRTHRLSPAQLRQVERAHASAAGDLDRAVRRLASGPDRSWPGASARRGRGTTSSSRRTGCSCSRARRPLPPRRRGLRLVGLLRGTVAGPGGAVLRPVGHRQDAGRRDHRRRRLAQHPRRSARRAW